MRGKAPVLTEASEYQGQEAIAVSCTQLGTDYTPSCAKRIVDEWIDLLSNPTSLSELQFTTRTPKHLFAALAGQTQLTRLIVKWGDYADLSPIGTMSALRHLELRGCRGCGRPARLGAVAQAGEARPRGHPKHR